MTLVYRQSALLGTGMAFLAIAFLFLVVCLA